MSTTGKIEGIVSNLIKISVDGPVGQNEICYIAHDETELMAEVIKIDGDTIAAQVFESTRGLKVGSKVRFTGEMLSVSLGPGLLSKTYDGLQNDLQKMDGVFLTRGEYTDPLEKEKKWDFTPTAAAGDTVQAGSWIGKVKENWLDHKIMVPFDLSGTATIKTIVDEGAYTSDEEIAVIVDENGEERSLTMTVKWAVKEGITAYKNKPRPKKMFETGVRAIDTLNPIAEGGTGFIPGPFGAGKTVLQHALSMHAEADIIVMVACGERANEVVEIFTEFPELEDPKSGRKLMERTIIIANTSNMPVAAREASVYTGMTIAEYYRSMGKKVLLLADSTSRWAQALREMSNRLEELPGQDAFPMDLSAIISNFYARNGYVELPNGESGSITFLGTVSPAGGNLKEPVTESTKKVARCFYALAQERADSKRYPAIDPIESYSKYLEYPEVAADLDEKIQKGWSEMVFEMKDILLRGKESREQINILGDDGVPIEYHVIFNKSEIIDFAILQQDAFNDIDASTPIERQAYMVNIVMNICRNSFEFDNFDEVGGFFIKIINFLKQMNYQEFQSDDFKRIEKELMEHVETRRIDFSQKEKYADESLDMEAELEAKEAGGVDR
ncbi:V-type ATP synthase subunit A [Chitinivibrio alkaliphilus]|uniref:V-type ATP synthase alpha chain n=1 Tax=Chitinivibrio alkaliphilus ACht1 TaxID=1313304 RepID=U7D7D9_9BACT|nr:V-type ATP synthase subunit A [Chitinivibrio alkaliphilus]ERP31838.1 V-type ATP synthase subunit A [Chitinivibrio alkaliphilus ACht1]